MNLALTLNEIEKILTDRIKDDQFKTLQSIPRPEQFKDMQKATNRIVQAINNKETIHLVGDYDVDGVISSAIMIEFFNKIGIQINSIIPNRFKHGYGLSPLILEDISDGIVITVDNGISANEAAQICKQKKIDLIITDHHTPPDILPKAYAIINPKQNDCLFPFKEICGAQVAWYLCASLKNALKIDLNLLEFFDLLALAIVADIMPMKSLNQTITKKGLQLLSQSNRFFVLALKEQYGLQTITEEDISFKIAPLINCAGRMSDPQYALDFILSKSKYDAIKNLDYLITLNEARKKEQFQMFEEAKIMLNQDEDVIVVADQNWNEGIIGIVASKLCEKYKKPAFVFCINETKAKASCRSSDDVDLYKLISHCSSLLNGYGGHKQAAGLSIDSNKIEQFKESLIKNIIHCKEKGVQKSNTLGELSIEHIDYKLYNLIESFRPYGITNPYPLFTFTNLEVLNVQKIGKNKEYSKLIVSNGIRSIEVLVFIDVEPIYLGQTIHFIAQIGKNEFKNEITYQLLLKELIKL